MFDPVIRTGDKVICVDAHLGTSPHRLQLLCKDRLKLGSVYKVTDIVWLYGEKGLLLSGLDHRPTDGWRASRFRKLRDVDAELEEAGVAWGKVCSAPLWFLGTHVEIR
jgi:hypothetical protein